MKVAVLSSLLSSLALASPSFANSKELSRGASVTILPPPPGITGDTLAKIATALTDGEFITASDGMTWRADTAPVWKYGGPVSFSADLGKTYEIDEISIRLLGGSEPRGGGQAKGFPIQVEAFVSDDGENYRKVGTFSRWTPGDFEKYKVPADRGKAWMHPLRFSSLGEKGRWVGLRVYTSGLTTTDEITVTGSALGRNDATREPQPFEERRSDFTIHYPQLYFHRPAVELATNAALPIPLGAAASPGMTVDEVTFELILPSGLELKGGAFGEIDLRTVTAEPQSDGTTRYTIKNTAEINHPSWNQRKHFARFYVQATGLSTGVTTEIQYRYGYDSKWQSALLTLPVKVKTLHQVPQLQHLMVGLGWWYPNENIGWPDALENFSRIGFNTVSFTTSRSLPWHLQEDHPSIQWLKKARNEGFKVALIDNTIHRLLAHFPDAKELRCQYGNDEYGDTFCPSYRGEYWQKELQRYGKIVELVQPDFISQDIEIYKMADRLDFDFSDQQKEQRRCVRCKSDYEASGIKSARQWSQSKGLEMWTQMYAEAKSALAKNGKIDFRNSGYNFRPGYTYQDVWNYDQLDEAKLLDHSQVSNYTTLYPRHLIDIGDRIRKDRQRLQRGTVMPWLTPGDAGTYPGKTFQWMALEAYLNGAKGIWFWSNRLWDSDLMIAYNKVVHALAPVEGILDQGELSDTNVVGKGRVSAIRHGEQTLMLVADYLGDTEGDVQIQLKLKEPSRIVDLLNRETIREISETGPHILRIPLKGEDARLLLVEPFAVNTTSY